MTSRRPPLTAKQRKAVDSISGARRVSSMEIEVFVADADDPGCADADETNAALAQVRDAGVAWGGYRTGYGAWVLKRDYVTDDADFNDRCSRHHY